MIRKLDPKNLFENLSPERPQLLAVSGGSDSVALLLLAAAWANMRDGQILVATVDHGLRPEAAAEAAFVASLCEGLNISHVTLAWEGLKPRSSISEAAREARYRLLSEYAKDCDCETILVGHTSDDQVETLMMRNSRGDESSESLGLSGMAAETLLPGGTKLLRPLLGVSRQQLRDYLKEHNQGWIEDPSNEDLSYERVRMRNKAQANPELADAYFRFGLLTGRFRKCFGRDVAGILLRDVEARAGPVFHVRDDIVKRIGRPLARYLLQIVIAMAGGGTFLVRAASLDGILDSTKSARTTIGNAVVERGKDGYRVFRETRNLRAQVVDGGSSVIWDNRVLVRNKSQEPVLCGVPTAEQLKEFERKNAIKLKVKPRAALLSTLMICSADDEIFLPFAADGSLPAKVTVQLFCRPIEHFCPDFDFPLLAAIDEIRSGMPCLGSLPG